MIAMVGLGLKYMLVKQVGLRVTRIFEYVNLLNESLSWKCEKHLHKARFYTSNKTQSSKLMIKMVKTSI